MRPACVAIMALLLVALTPSAALAQPVVAPVLREGDLWGWELFDSDRREMVAGTERVGFGGVEVEAVRIERAQSLAASGGAAGGGEARAVTVWLRASDLAYLQSVSRPVGGDGQDGATHEHVAAAPCQTYRWPLTVGDAWEDDCGAAFAWPWGDVALTSAVWRSVVAFEQVNVSAGWFEAYVIETREGSESGALLARVWYAPETCSDVRRERWIEGIAHVQELASYRCGETATMQTPPSEGTPPTMPPPTAPTPPYQSPFPPDPCTAVVGARCTSTPTGAPLFAALGVAALALAARKRS